MLKFKRAMNCFLQYPLMWVMLLWAFTRPGHEVMVYDFLLTAISGHTDSEFTHPHEAFSQSENQQNTSHVFLDAAPAASIGKIQSQLLHIIPSGFSFSFHQPETHFSFSAYTLQAIVFQKLLLVSVLPNAP